MVDELVNIYLSRRNYLILLREGCLSKFVFLIVWKRSDSFRAYPNLEFPRQPYLIAPPRFG